MPLDDLEQYADSEVDFYELLGLTPSSTLGSNEIRKAWRKQSLQYHPDKNPDPKAIEKFHLLQIALDVLSDEKVRTLYDGKRAAKEQRKRQKELFEGHRRQMTEALEKAEGSGKRKRDEDNNEQHRLDMEIRRLAEDGKRRRKEREEQLRREKLEEEVAQDAKEEQQQQAIPAQSEIHSIGGTSDLDRSIKVRWIREGKGTTIDMDQLSSVLARFGEVDMIVPLKDKKTRVDGVKKAVASAMVVFKSIVGAHAAVTDATKLELDEPWIKELVWVNEQASKPEQVSQTKLPASMTDSQAEPTTSKPSFGGGAFSAKGSQSTKSKPTPAFGAGASLEEVTMMRLKNAEKQRLEKQIREAEAAEDAAG